MVERTPSDFATTETETEQGDFWSRLERILKRPEVQQRLLAEAPEEVQSAVMSEFTETPTETDATETDTTTETATDAAVSPEKLVEFLGEIEAQVGGGYTVSQLRTFAQSNPDMVESLLDEYL